MFRFPVLASRALGALSRVHAQDPRAKIYSEAGILASTPVRPKLAAAAAARPAWLFVIGL